MDTDIVSGAANPTVNITYFRENGEEEVVTKIVRIRQCTVDMLRRIFGIGMERDLFLRERVTDTIILAGEDGIFSNLTNGRLYELETSPAIAFHRNQNADLNFNGMRNVSLGAGLPSPRSLVTGLGIPARVGASSTTRHRSSMEQEEVTIYFIMGVKMPNGMIAGIMALAGGPIEIPVVLRADNVSSISLLNDHVSAAVIAAGHAGPYLHFQVRRGSGALLTESNQEVKNLEFWIKARRTQSKFYAVAKIEVDEDDEPDDGQYVARATAPKRKAVSAGTGATATVSKMAKSDLDNVKSGVDETVTKSLTTFRQQMLVAIRRSLREQSVQPNDPQAGNMRGILRGIADRLMCKICFKAGGSMFICPECGYIVICGDCKGQLRRSGVGYPCPNCQFSHVSLSGFVRINLGEEAVRLEEWRVAEDNAGAGPSGNGNSGDATGPSGNGDESGEEY